MYPWELEAEFKRQVADFHARASSVGMTVVDVLDPESTMEYRALIHHQVMGEATAVLTNLYKECTQADLCGDQGVSIRVGLQCLCCAAPNSESWFSRRFPIIQAVAAKNGFTKIVYGYTCPVDSWEDYTKCWPRDAQYEPLPPTGLDWLRLVEKQKCSTIPRLQPELLDLGW